MPMLFAALVLTPLQSPEPTVLLRYNPPVGTQVTYANVVKMTQTVPGMAKPIETTTTSSFTLRVLSHENGVFTLESKNGASKVEMAPDSPLVGMKDRLEKIGSGVTSTMTIDESGTIKSVAVKAEGQESAVAKQVMNGVGQSLSGVSLPARALKVGDTWQSEMDMGKMLQPALGSSAKLTSKFPILMRLAAIEKVGERTLARIALSMKGNVTVTVQGMAVKATMGATGETVVDVATGLTQSSTSVVDTDMTIQGQTMHQHLVTSLTRQPAADPTASGK